MNTDKSGNEVKQLTYNSGLYPLGCWIGKVYRQNGNVYITVWDRDGKTPGSSIQNGIYDLTSVPKIPIDV